MFSVSFKTDPKSNPVVQRFKTHAKAEDYAYKKANEFKNTQINIVDYSTGNSEILFIDSFNKD